MPENNLIFFWAKRSTGCFTAVAPFDVVPNLNNPFFSGGTSQLANGKSPVVTAWRSWHVKSRFHQQLEVQINTAKRRQGSGIHFGERCRRATELTRELDGLHLTEPVLGE